jgi:hypothetical protein
LATAAPDASSVTYGTPGLRKPSSSARAAICLAEGGDSLCETRMGWRARETASWRQTLRLRDTGGG